jgi:hypothetical protein
MTLQKKLQINYYHYCIKKNIIRKLGLPQAHGSWQIIQSLIFHISYSWGFMQVFIKLIDVTA